jgi:hypothetical protein
MEEQRPGFLLTFPVVVEMAPGTSPDDPNSPLWDLADRIQRAINEVVAAEREDLGSHQVVALDLQDGRSNAARCAECGAWTTDWLAPRPIEALRRGMIVDGRLLCEDELDEGQVARLYPRGAEAQ